MINKENIFTKSFILYCLYLLWFGFCLLSIPQLAQSYQDLTLILSFFGIPAVFGISKFTNLKFTSFPFLTLLIFLFLTGLTQLLTPNFFAGLDSLRGLHLKLLIIIISFIFLLKEETALHYLLGGIICGMFIATFFSYYYYFLPDTWHIWQNSTPDWPNAISPFGGHKNFYAARFSYYLPLLTGYAVYLFQNSRKKITKFYATSIFILVFLAIPALIFTKSRASQGATLLGLSLMVIYIFHRQPLKLITVVLLGTLIVMGFYYSSELTQHSLTRWQKALSLKTTFSGRINRVWPATLKAIYKRPLLGYAIEDVAHLSRPTHAHNVYLYYWLRTGAIGLIGFIILSIGLIANCLYKFIVTENSHQILLVSLTIAYFSGVLVRGIVAAPPLLPHFGILLGFYLGLDQNYYNHQT